MIMSVKSLSEPLKKFAKKYKEGKIKVEDVKMTGDPTVPESLVFEIRLPLYDRFGDPTGEETKFQTSVASLLQIRQAFNEDADAKIAEADVFNTAFTEILECLDDVKNKKK